VADKWEGKRRIKDKRESVISGNRRVSRTRVWSNKGALNSGSNRKRR
jgi:hypothetical protein